MEELGRGVGKNSSRLKSTLHIRRLITHTSLSISWTFLVTVIPFGWHSSTMPLPQPKVPLKDHCSIIYNDTLYTYQPDAFQSLDLKEGGEWAQLPMGVSTRGSACVQGSVNDQVAFIVVGGTASQQGYKGLQHYSFKSNSWTSDHPADEVVTNRERHGAVYLQHTSQIVTYGGSQDGNTGPTSQTFAISTKSPYATQAFSSTAPPVIDPLMLSYNSTHALMLGGETSNTNLYTFSPSDQWQRLDVSLQDGLKDSDKTQAIILDGDDGSKLLEIFEMSATPNQISSLRLKNATSPSNHKRSASYLSSPHHPTKRRKRDTSLANRPAYNSTLAPQDSRTGFSLTSDPKTGLTVASGGNRQVPLAMFNETSNQWIDPNQFFSSKPESTPTPTPSASSSSSSSSKNPATYSPTAAPSAVAGANSNARNKSLTILGGVLGAVLGAAIFLVLLLLLLRHHKRRKEREQREKRDLALRQKEEMDFTDIGADFMREAGGSRSRSNHERNKSETSAKYSGRSRAPSSQSKRALLHAKGDSADSGGSFWSHGRRSPEKSPPQISAPMMGPSLTRSIASPDPRGPESGWSRYFLNEKAQERQPSKSSSAQDTRPPTFFSNANSQSDYSSSRITSHAHESAEVEPLNLRPSQLSIPPHPHSVSPTGYPPTNLGIALTHGGPPPLPSQSPTPSIVSDIEEEDEDDYRHSNGQDSWSPVESTGERYSNLTDEQPMSNYTNSVASPRTVEKMQIPNFPMPSSKNSTATSPTSPQGEQLRNGLRNVVSRDLIRSNSSRQRATDIIRTGTQRVTPSATPGVHNFQRPAEQTVSRRRPSSNSEDMSWLNLGSNSMEQPRHHNFPGL